MLEKNTDKEQLKLSLIDSLVTDYNLTSSEAESVAEKIDFDCAYVIEYIDSPKKLEFFTTLEYVKDNIYISPTELKNSYYGVSKNPYISLGQYIKVAIQEKQETITWIRNPENSLETGNINIIEDVKTLIKRPEFDPYKSYVGVKKVEHKITSIFNSDYFAYVILIYEPNSKKVKKYLKTKNTIKKFIK